MTWNSQRTIFIITAFDLGVYFFRKNINCSIAESLRRFEEVMEAAKEIQMPVRGWVVQVIKWITSPHLKIILARGAMWHGLVTSSTAFYKHSKWYHIWFDSFNFCNSLITLMLLIVGWGSGLLRCWSPSTMWAGSLIFQYHHWGCLNNPIFSNLGLCATCWAHFMCHQELWPALASHPFSSLFRPCWRKILQKNYYPYLKTCSSKFCSSKLLSVYSFWRFFFSHFPTSRITKHR